MSHAKEAPRRAVLVMNPRSGNGAVARFGLVEAAEHLGVEALLTSAEQDAASLARRAVAEGAEVLGVAGGDGTVSAVAAVAAGADLPLLVVPAGTRNHFARDLGLDVHRPATSLTALDGGEEARVDLGSVGGRTFVNNVSFGVYADALLTPGYRQSKGYAFASVAGPYLEGRQWVDADVETPRGTVQRPQLILVSNNAYHFETAHHLGRRVALDAGTLGAIVVKRPAGLPPERVPEWAREWLAGGAAPHWNGLTAWSSPRVALQSAAATLAAGVDGEAVSLPLPVVCEITLGALRVLLPTG